MQKKASAMLKVAYILDKKEQSTLYSYLRLYERHYIRDYKS